ncbi:PQQ-dependent sugar dehydrogenase [Phenylobacterium sp.]|uniref:PQQ-dependent sugar dehydrogenase n=1 Tax=Phenylobacterium sp. TaxID=1871053 RepID=UPI0025CD88D2|nr:PQQ-dependent sugar dehydrogenase [Phenylobacterium sp.]
MRATRTTMGLSLAMALTSLTSAWPQTPPAPAYPPGPGYAGVAGSPEENARITALCGKNRNAADGYAPAPAFPGQTRAPKAPARQPFTVETVAKIDRPWGMAILPNGQLLVAIRAGGMRIVDPDGKVSEPLANVPAIQNARLSALYDVSLDRDFAKTRTIYFGYVTKADTGTAAVGRIAKARLSADEKSLENVTTLREGADIVPRRIVQAPDGTLLIPSAVIDSGGPNPQALDSQLGKILRINTDGTIPKNNPFLKDPKANPALYALGFRDVHGAAFDPKTGKLWVAENTPMGGDELNLIRAGGNYGFPIISYGRENSGALIDGGKTAEAGMEQPVYYWNPSIAPSGMLFYTGAALPGWKGSVFIGGLSGQQLVRLEMKNGKVTGEEKLLMDTCHRIKTVAQGPDGLIYLATDEPKGAEILRLKPAKK